MRVVQCPMVTSGDMRCSLRYDLIFLFVCFVSIVYLLAEPTAVKVFRFFFQIPGRRSTGRQLKHGIEHGQRSLC
jgi:hypothetical protein